MPSWSTPPAWAGGVIVGGAAGLQKMSDDLATLGNAATVFDSTGVSWGGSGGGTPAPGTGGSFSGRARQDNKWADVEYKLVLGTGFVVPTGGWQFALPVNALDTFLGVWTARALDVSVSTSQGYEITCDMNLVGVVSLRCA